MKNNILLIESNNSIINDLEKMLISYNFNTLKIDKDRDAIDYISQLNPLAVIAEFDPNNGNPLNLLQSLKENDQFLTIPFIIISEFVDFTKFRKAMNEGADDFFFYPIDQDEFIQRLNYLIAKNNRARMINATS